MKKILSLILTFTFIVPSLLMAENDNVAQTVSVVANDIAIMDASLSAKTLTFTTPTVPGDLPANQDDSTTYLRYTANALPNYARAIDAQLGADEYAALGGYTLKIEALSIGENGTGDKGTVVEGGVTLSSATAQNIITSIASCNTGSDATDGANLKYSTVITDMPKIGTDVYTVTLTLRDDAEEIA